MQAKGKNGVLLKRAVQDIISNVPENNTVSIITNSETFKNTSIAAIKNELLTLPFSSNPEAYNTILLKSKNLFSKTSNTLKNLIYISDFQNQTEPFKPENDSLISIYAVKLEPVNTQNTAIDSAYISNISPTKLELTVALSNSGNAISNLPISLLNNGNLIAKSSTEINNEAKVIFELPFKEVINGEIKINDTHLQFDNRLYFNINTTDKINVLSVGDTISNFLGRIYTKDEFQFSNYALKDLDYNAIDEQNLIILNEIKSIPIALSTALKTFSNNGGSILIIPSKGASINNYNNLLSNYGLAIKSLTTSEKKITNINYSHPLYFNNNVFEKRVTNFQYPKVNSFYTLNSNLSSTILSYEDGKPFLTNNGSTYMLTASLSKENSNFTSSPLIVPTLYNIAKNSFKIPSLYYNIGTSNTFEVKVNLQQDGVLAFEKDENRLIPKQQSFANKVMITTDETPSKAGIYNIKNGTETIKNVSYNYNRTESLLQYQDIDKMPNIELHDSISGLFETLKSNTKVNALWKWFVIFALIMLLTEMLILKYFK
ncbi:BatA and WFA domain-containing protein [Flavobacteriaceae bacterium MHTCC 0001]